MRIDHVAVLGTSPLSLFRAVSEAQQGRHVTIYDKSLTLGGAWSPRQLFGVGGADGKSHIWAPLYHSGAYQKLVDSLRTDLGIRLELVEPTAVYPTAEGEASEVGIPAFYPAQGMSEALDRLEVILRDLGVVFRLGEAVTAARATHEAVFLEVSECEDQYDILYLPSYVALDSINLDGYSYAIPFEPRRSIHLNLLLDRQVGFSYLEAPEELTYLDRLCDISRCFQDHPHFDASFAAVNARVDYPGKILLESSGREVFVEKSVKELLVHGYLSKTTQLLKHDFTEYTTAYRNEAAKQELYRLKWDRIRVMYTEQLMEGLHDAIRPSQSSWDPPNTRGPTSQHHN